MTRVLIVDDNTDVLYVMKLIFTLRDFEVSGTIKGEETFSLVDTFKPELIMLDINLSGLDGIEICRELKTNKETTHIPIILFSANVFKAAFLDRSLADDFIAKPFDVAELMLKVNRLIISPRNTKSMTA